MGGSIACRRDLKAKAKTRCKTRAKGRCTKSAVASQRPQELESDMRDKRWLDTVYQAYIETTAGFTAGQVRAEDTSRCVAICMVFCWEKKYSLVGAKAEFTTWSKLMEHVVED